MFFETRQSLALSRFISPGIRRVGQESSKFCRNAHLFKGRKLMSSFAIMALGAVKEGAPLAFIVCAPALLGGRGGAPPSAPPMPGIDADSEASPPKGQGECVAQSKFAPPAPGGAYRPPVPAEATYPGA